MPITVAARFSLTVDGHEIGQFSELAGINTEVGVVDYVPTPEDRALVLRLAGDSIWTNVMLARARTSDPRLWDWLKSVQDGNLGSARKSCSLTMYDSSGGKTVARYCLDNAWPSKIEIGRLRNSATPVLQEIVTLTCRSVRRIWP